MKATSPILAGIIVLTTALASASSSDVEVSASKALANRLEVRILGAAAQTISSHLSQNGVQMRRDPFSGAMVQEGAGVKCIEDDSDTADGGLYCYIAIDGATIK